MYHRYPEPIIFTKLITPLKFDEYNLWSLGVDCPSIGVLCNSQVGRGRGCGGGMGQYIFSIRKQHSVNKDTRV